MAHGTDGEPGLLIDQTIAELTEELSPGLTPEQAAWALSALRETILPWWLSNPLEGEDAEDDDGDLGDSPLDLIGEFRAALAQDSPPERLQRVEALEFLARLHRMNRQAQALASQRRETGEVTETARQAVAELYGEYAQLLEETAERSSDLFESMKALVVRFFATLEEAAGEGGLESVLPEPDEEEPEPAAAACPRCGNANPAGSRFCNQCGQAFCPGCGNANPSGSRFCNSCGADLSA